MMRRTIMLITFAALSSLLISSSAYADRIYSSMEKCNKKCHGVCFMESSGAHCYWGAIKQAPKKVDPTVAPPKSTDGAATPRN